MEFLYTNEKISEKLTDSVQILVLSKKNPTFLGTEDSDLLIINSMPNGIRHFSVILWSSSPLDQQYYVHVLSSKYRLKFFMFASNAFEKLTLSHAISLALAALKKKSSSNFEIS